MYRRVSVCVRLVCVCLLSAKRKPRVGFLFRGGKADDTTAVVAWTVSLNTWRKLAEAKRDFDFYRQADDEAFFAERNLEASPRSPHVV